MDSLLNRRTIHYNFRNLQEFQSERKRTVFYGLETISYRAPQLWTILPEEFKQRNTISLFKNDVRQWICNECPCGLCKIFVPNLGFISVQLLTWYLIFIIDFLARVYVCMCVYVCACMCVYVCVYMYIYIYVCVCVCVCVCMYVCMCVCVYMYMYIYVGMYVCVCMYVYVCVCMCVYMYVYIYIYFLYVLPSREMHFQLEICWYLLLFGMYLPARTHFINFNFLILLGFFVVDVNYFFNYCKH